MFINPINSIIITVHPKCITAAVDTVAKFTVTATGSNLTYQWQYLIPDGTVWVNTTLTGSKTDTLPVYTVAARDGFAYRCKIADNEGNTVYSAAAVLTVQPGMSIIVQPRDIAAIEDDIARFSVTASGDGLTYQWQHKAPNGTAWEDNLNFGSWTSALAVVATAGRDGYSYRCRVTDSAGNIRYTEPVMLTVTSLPFGPAEEWPVYRATVFEAEDCFPDWEVGGGREEIFQDLEDDFPF